MSRILDLDSAQLAHLRGRELTASVAASEGRAVVAEVWANMTLLMSAHETGGVSNIEVAAAFGADIVIINALETVFDGDRWNLAVLGGFDRLADIADAVGRPIGVNLEPGTVPELRKATVENAKRLVDQGVALLCVTANPATGATLDDIARTSEELRRGLGDDVAIWSGKMHMAGRIETLDAGRMAAVAEAGADGVLVPLPGTVPGVTREIAAEAVRRIHAAGAVAMGTIGTSQEGSHRNLVPQLALNAKEIGVDAHHIGDAYAAGSMDPEFLYDYSVAIRGRRHTWHRMGRNTRKRG
ncbi:haloacid dehalogenase-like hydrolase [Streptomyces sp. TRM66268-LWL]|uniref:Haloacid dehalogenase-like hydrolase n=1 Tax=Streptomyces polyasparticus TaxID=2767826 RepID=A0ABR7SU53_9ACTN|nr:haloacid dehalogenase-like hydrolase [Streptomyces polyasparticus]MBC9719031.1 haloacid dehalogenase-like hydrolase [Streptomyces polyasparticus]